MFMQVLITDNSYKAKQGYKRLNCITKPSFATPLLPSFLAN